MTTINRQAKGLNDLLQVQAGGRNPDEFSQLVRGTVDMYPFYQADRLRAFVEPFSLQIGQREFIEVPDGEAWLIEFLTVEVDSFDSANDDVQFSFGIERLIGQGLNGVELAPTGRLTQDSSSANSILVGGGQLPRPIMVTAGQRITLLLGDESQGGGGATTGNFNVVYTLLNV